MCIELLGHEGEQLGRQSKQRQRRMESGGCESRCVPDYFEPSLVRGAMAVNLLRDAGRRQQHVKWRLFASGPVRPASLSVRAA